jgi:hypothetical protein
MSRTCGHLGGQPVAQQRYLPMGKRWPGGSGSTNCVGVEDLHPGEGLDHCGRGQQNAFGCLGPRGPRLLRRNKKRLQWLRHPYTSTHAALQQFRAVKQPPPLTLNLFWRFIMLTAEQVLASHKATIETLFGLTPRPSKASRSWSS